MLTYSGALSTLQSLTGVLSTDTTNSTLLMQFWNDSRRTIASINGGKWPWLEVEESVLSVANQDYVYIPNDVRRVMGVRVNVGGGSTSPIYLPRLLFDSDKWEIVVASRLGTSDVPNFVYQRGQKLLFYPTPASSGNIVGIIGRRNLRDITTPDYTAGTVASITNGSTTVIGTGTVWNASMVGSYIQIATTAASNGGDGFWYEIANINSTTSLELLKPYQGFNIAAATNAYTIGQITYEPEAYQMAPIYRAIAQFWQFKENFDLADRYWMMYDGGQEVGKSKLVAGLVGQMMSEANESMEGPMIQPWPRDGNFGGIQAPYYQPYLDATGF